MKNLRCAAPNLCVAGGRQGRCAVLALCGGSRTYGGLGGAAASREPECCLAAPPGMFGCFCLKSRIRVLGRAEPGSCWRGLLGRWAVPTLCGWLAACGAPEGLRRRAEL